jgi:hypothetical protein
VSRLNLYGRDYASGSCLVKTSLSRASGQEAAYDEGAKTAPAAPHRPLAAEGLRNGAAGATNLRRPNCCFQLA